MPATPSTPTNTTSTAAAAANKTAAAAPKRSVPPPIFGMNTAPRKPQQESKKMPALSTKTATTNNPFATGSNKGCRPHGVQSGVVVITNPTMLTALRIHRNFDASASANAPHAKDMERLRNSVSSSFAFSTIVAVAAPAKDALLIEGVQSVLDEEESKVKSDPAKTNASILRAKLIPVSDWGNFVPALNQLVMTAATLGSKRICFRSVEMDAPVKEIQTLERHLEDDTLVVGKCISGHQFETTKENLPQTVSLSGVTAPWNTLAIWDVKKLSLTGFLMVAEGFEKFGTVGGVEEVSVISLHQKLNPSQSKAKLIRFATQHEKDGWTAEWKHDEQREAWHKKKMESKVSRPASHLKLLNLDGVGVVEHIECE
ncbi:hypothetical protein HDU97_010166 [Phlyctochytrium planicorne]|nr:hypothetical protein HDU97_010166 [Phlyctochytrium planicorne]